MIVIINLQLIRLFSGPFNGIVIDFLHAGHNIELIILGNLLVLAISGCSRLNHKGMQQGWWECLLKERMLE